MPRRFVLLTLALCGVSLVSFSHAGSASPAADLATLCGDYWEGHLTAHPTAATALGDHRYDDRLSDNTPSGTEADRKRLEAVMARVRAIPEDGLDPGERLTRSALIVEVQGQLDEISCGFDDWVVDPLGGPQVELLNLVDLTRFETVEDGRNFVKRCRAMGPFMDAHVVNLGRGVNLKRVASRDAILKVLEELDALAAQPFEKWALMQPLESPHAEWSAADRDKFRNDLTTVVRDEVKPAFGRYGYFLRSRLLPIARPPERAGLSNLPGGLECYAKCIRTQTSLDRTPEELHQLGLAEVARFRRELSVLGMKALGTADIPEIQRRLRADTSMHFRSAEEVEAKAMVAFARARAAIPKWFGALPKADCVVKVMGMHEAPNSTIAYYRQPAIDGTRPGYYMINTFKPETRPRYEAEALAFHEAIPGHHLQIAIAQELTNVPEFRKHQGVTAYVEGWALYTERLADEMGLYSSDADRIGMLSFDAWRACRLVVDTGMHAMGWSRQQAIDYMVENSVLAENNIGNEVDRYLTWPGQALAYKCGQIEILALRDEARKRLGDKFDIRRFHDVVLRNGALALPVLREQVEAWIVTEGPR